MESIPVKTEAEIKIMEDGGRILAKIIKQLEGMVKPGITTNQLNKAAEDLVFKYGAKPSFKNYLGFPAVLCVSLNEEIVHGLPSERKIKRGDLVSLDLGILYNGFHTDMAVTIPVDVNDQKISELIKVTKESLKRAIKKAIPGNAFGDIAYEVQSYIESQGFNVVRELCGHGIGKAIHEEPQVLNCGKKGTGPKIKEGMVFCIEPMATIGEWRIKKAKDGYGYETKDGSISAHFEHTIAVTKKGPKILTEI